MTKGIASEANRRHNPVMDLGVSEIIEVVEGQVPTAPAQA
jgi:hypothetical protein